MFLQLTVVFSLLLPTFQQEDKDCGRVILTNRSKIEDNYMDCTRASKILFYKNTQQIYFLQQLAFLQEIQSETSKNDLYVPLRIEYSYTEVFHSVPFLPRLTRIIPHPQLQRAVIFIRNNDPFCINDDDRNRLLAVADGRGYIQECTCNTLIENATTSLLAGGPRCETVVGTLEFDGKSVMFDKWRKQLESVERLKGGRLIVDGTNFESLDFLKNLKEIRYSSSEIEAGSIVHIANNPKLRSLGFLLDTIKLMSNEESSNRQHPLILIENNPLLKITPAEMEHIETYIVSNLDEEADVDPIVFKPVYCELVHPIVENLHTVADCTYIRGNLTIDESFNDLSPLEMEELFGYLRVLDGCLTIKGTKLEELTFLHDLITINCRSPRPAVTIVNNSQLKWLELQVNDFGNSTSLLTFRITNNPRLCYKEVDYLKSILDSPWRVIEFDRWKSQCTEVWRESRMSLLQYHMVVAVIIGFGLVAAEGALWAVKWRRRQMARKSDED